MRPTIFLFSAFLLWTVRCNPMIKIHDLKFNGNFSEVIYKTKILVSKYSSLDISLNETNYSYEFAIMQAHCHHVDISMSLEIGTNESITQYGTNFGFLIKSDHSEKLFQLTNNNNDDVHCLIALIAYPKSSPIPGNCSAIETSTNIEMITLMEQPDILTAVIPHNMCNDSGFTYETYYTYVDIMDFGIDAFFDGIERVFYDSIFMEYQAKHVPIKNKHLFEMIPGRAIIINTVIKGSNGKMTYFVPVSTYSCPANTWSSHCTESNYVRRGFSIVLILLSVVMILNLMAPEFIESILNGMLYGGFVTILLIKGFDFELEGFDYFITVIVGSFVISAVLGLITIYFSIGQFMSKFTLSMFFAIFVMEIFFDSITSAYLVVIAAVTLSIFLSFVPITCAVILGCLLLILNISYLYKTSNLHRFMLNSFFALTTMPAESINETYFDFIRPNYINYKVTLNYVDYIMLVLYIVMSIYFTIRKEKFFFWHPEALESSFMRSEYDRMMEEQNAWNKARHDDFISQFGKQHDVGHYGPIKGCHGHMLSKIRTMHPIYDKQNYPLNRPPVIDVDSDGGYHTPPENQDVPKIIVHSENQVVPINRAKSDSPPKRNDEEMAENRRKKRPASASYDQIDVLGSTFTFKK